MQKRYLKGYSPILWVIPVIFLGVFLFIPLFSIFNLAVQSASRGIAEIDWSRVWNTLGFTIWQATLSALLTILVGLPAAFLFGRFVFPGKKVLRILATLPFILPTVVVAAGFNALIGPNGWLNLVVMQFFHLSQPPIQILNSIYAILLAHVFYNTAVVIRTVGAALEHMDSRLEEVSRTLGASPWRSFWKVTFPLLRPALASATLLVFLFDFTSFGVILLLGGPQFATLEVEIYYQTVQLLNLPFAAILSVIQMVCTLILTVMILRGGGGVAVPVASHTQSNISKSMHSWKEKMFVMGMVTILVILLVFPLGALTLRSVTKTTIDGNGSESLSPTLTLDYYQELFVNRRGSVFYVPPVEALRNSLLYALAATIIAIIIGGLASYALIQKNQINFLFDPLLMLPLGTSAVTLGLGFIVTLALLPNSRDFYPFLIPVAHSLVALPFVVRVIQPALASIPNSLKQAAATLGAAPLMVWFKVELPIIARAVAVAALFAFSISLGEFGATSFLSRPDLPTLPIAISRFLNLPGSLNYGQALALATILMFVCALVMILIDLFNVRTEMN